MKTNYALVTGLFLATGLIAQTNSSVPMVAPTTSLRPTPAAAPAATAATAATTATNKPAAKPATKSSSAAKKPAAKPAPKKVEKIVTLLPGTATVDATHVNVRGRSTILSEQLAKLNKGDTITVIEQVENKWSKGDDLKQWAHIVYPSNAPVWIFTSFVDSNKVVTAPKLNLRGGPSENYSIIGRLTKGATVKEIKTKGEWMQIEAPAGCSAYVGAIFLKQDSAAIAAATTPPTTLPPASTNVIAEADPQIPPVADAATTNAALNELREFANQLGGTNATPITEEPLPPRVVMREGTVDNVTSVQAPTTYGLAGIDTRRRINYLYTTSTNVDLFNYVGRHVIVTGEESLDERWPNTPVLKLQRIQVIDDEKK
ncbi:MAG: hypothetical protein RLY20_2330 [Verrucomicrobiota bacterium]|jgi:uncharacterized protein YgiM (DUF1202 family)